MLNAIQTRPHPTHHNSPYPASVYQKQQQAAMAKQPTQQDIYAAQCVAYWSNTGVFVLFAFQVKPFSISAIFAETKKAMKNIFLLFFALFFFSAHSQERNFDDYLHETSPVFPGCENAANRYYCYILKVSEAVRDKVNLYAKDIAVNELQATLRLQNETSGKTTVLRLETENKVMEKAATEALDNLPLIMPQPVNGKTSTSSAGFLVVLHRKDASSAFEVVVQPKKNNANIPHPADLKFEDAIFPGCENVQKKERRSCFSHNFSEWLSSRLPKDAKSKFPNEQATLIVTFGREGKLSKLEVKTNSDKLKKLLEKIMESCPDVIPATANGEKSTASYSIPVYFR